MRKKLWISLVLLFVIPGLLSTVSCAKKTIKSQPSITQPAEDEAAKKAAEKAKQEELEKQRALKVGMAFDKGFGATVQLKNVNGFIGNDGLAVDYIFSLKKIKPKPDISFSKDVSFYVGVGGTFEWGHSLNHQHRKDTRWHSHDYQEFGLRVPFGLTLPFAQNWEAYGQVAPDLEYHTYHKDYEFGLNVAFGLRYAF